MARSESSNQRNQRFLARYGATILRGGIATIPKALYKYQAELGLKPQQVWFISAILAHKWDEDMPKPSLKRMALQTGVTEQALHNYKNQLIDAGWLAIVNRHNRLGGQESNYYDFSALFGALEERLRRDKPQPEDHADDDEEDDHALADGENVENSGGHLAGGLNVRLARGLNTRSPRGLNGHLALKESGDQEAGEKEARIFSKRREPDALHKTKPGFQRKEVIRKQIARATELDGVAEEGTGSPPSGWSSVHQVLARTQPSQRSAGGVSVGTGRGRPPKAPPYIEAVMEDISSRLHDNNPRSSLTRATRLWRASGLAEEQFVHDVLYAARSRTQAQGNVKKRASDGYGTINRVPYFFAVVEDLLGLRGEEPPR
jgi:hypothetical protein